MKDYDSTLARMAGNIAAGFVVNRSAGVLPASTCEQIADTSVDIATRIIAKCKANYAALPEMK